jgi:hypothetical protein
MVNTWLAQLACKWLESIHWSQASVARLLSQALCIGTPQARVNQKNTCLPSSEVWQPPVTGPQCPYALVAASPWTRSLQPERHVPNARTVCVLCVRTCMCQLCKSNCQKQVACSVMRCASLRRASYVSMEYPRCRLSCETMSSTMCMEPNHQ